MKARHGALFVVTVSFVACGEVEELPVEDASLCELAPGTVVVASKELAVKGLAGTETFGPVDVAMEGARVGVVIVKSATFFTETTTVGTATDPADGQAYWAATTGSGANAGAGAYLIALSDDGGASWSTHDVSPPGWIDGIHLDGGRIYLEVGQTQMVSGRSTNILEVRELDPATFTIGPVIGAPFRGFDGTSFFAGHARVDFSGGNVSAYALGLNAGVDPDAYPDAVVGVAEWQRIDLHTGAVAVDTASITARDARDLFPIAPFITADDGLTYRALSIPPDGRTRCFATVAPAQSLVPKLDCYPAVQIPVGGVAGSDAGVVALSTQSYADGGPNGGALDPHAYATVFASAPPRIVHLGAGQAEDMLLPLPLAHSRFRSLVAVRAVDGGERYVRIPPSGPALEVPLRSGHCAGAVPAVTLVRALPVPGSANEWLELYGVRTLSTQYVLARRDVVTPTSIGEPPPGQPGALPACKASIPPASALDSACVRLASCIARVKPDDAFDLGFCVAGWASADPAARAAFIANPEAECQYGRTWGAKAIAEAAATREEDCTSWPSTTRCVGDVAESCQGVHARLTDCGTVGATCAIGADSHYRCAPVGTSCPQPKGPFASWCADDVVVFQTRTQSWYGISVGWALDGLHRAVSCTALGYGRCRDRYQSAPDEVATGFVPAWAYCAQ